MRSGGARCVRIDWKGWRRNQLAEALGQRDV
jgi:hypothetical protein